MVAMVASMSPIDAPYLLVEFFYPVIDSEYGVDVVGDEIIFDWLVPLIDKLRLDRAIERYEFMRYSVDGYHLRVKLRGARDRLEVARVAVVEPSLRSFRETHVERLGHRMVLGDFSQRLYQRLERSAGDVRSGGEYKLSYAKDEAALYEDLAMFEHYVEFSEILCDSIAAAMALTPDMKSRKAFVRLLLFDLLAAAQLNDDELYYVTRFIKRQWELYFAIEPEMVAQCRSNCLALAPKFYAFLDAKSGIPGSALALPSELRRLYEDRATRLCDIVPHLIRRQAHGGIGNNTALRLLSMVHLTHNRFGLDIAQELLFTDLISEYIGDRLDTDTVNHSRTWVEKNLEQYMSRRENIVY
jgi:Lantibiotic biosynthesis dehydratase C-term